MTFHDLTLEFLMHSTHKLDNFSLDKRLGTSLACRERTRHAECAHARSVPKIMARVLHDGRASFEDRVWVYTVYTYVSP